MKNNIFNGTSQTINQTNSNNIEMKSCPINNTFKIVGKAGLATITPNANQQLLIGSASGTVGAAGTAVSNNAGDCITFVCITSGSSTVYRANEVVGTWTLN